MEGGDVESYAESHRQARAAFGVVVALQDWIIDVRDVNRNDAALDDDLC